MDLFNNYTEAYDMAQQLAKTTAAAKKKKKKMAAAKNTNKIVDNPASSPLFPKKKNHEDDEDTISLAETTKSFETSSSSGSPQSRKTLASPRRRRSKATLDPVTLPSMLTSKNNATADQQPLVLLKSQAESVLKGIHKLKSGTYETKKDELRQLIQLHTERAQARLAGSNRVGAVLSAKKVHSAQLEQARVSAAISFLDQHKEAMQANLTRQMAQQDNDEQSSGDNDNIVDAMCSRLKFVALLNKDYEAEADKILQNERENGIVMPSDEELLRVLTLETKQGKQKNT